MKAVSERQRMSVKVNLVLCSESHDEAVEEFLSKMVSSGQRYTHHTYWLKHRAVYIIGILDIALLVIWGKVT